MKTNLTYEQKEEVYRRFPSGSKWYFIDEIGKIDDFIIHSGVSPLGAFIMSKVRVLYTTHVEAEQALADFNDCFITFSKTQK